MIRRLIKSGTAAGLRFTGILPVLINRKRRNAHPDGSAVILMYHRVLPSGDSDVDTPWTKVRSLPGIVVTPTTFEKQVHHLSTHYHLISLGDLVIRLESGQSPPDRSVVITFDDGWRDNYQYAFPILKRFRAPATIFLSTGYIGTEQVFWPEKIIQAVTVARESGADDSKVATIADPVIRRALAESLTVGSPDIVPALDRLINLLKTADHNLRDRITNLFPADGDHSVRVMLNWDEIQEMAEHSIEFGAHGVNHDILTEIDGEHQRREIEQSCAVLRHKLSPPVLTFAYPNGNYDGSIRRQVVDAGARCAVATIPGISSSASDRYALPRVNVHEGVSRGVLASFSPSLFDAHIHRVFG